MGALRTVELEFCAGWLALWPAGVTPFSVISGLLVYDSTILQTISYCEKIELRSMPSYLEVAGVFFSE